MTSALSTKYDHIIIVDLEATCWRKGETRGHFSEIIEIGLSRFCFDKLEPLDKKSILIRPSLSTVSTYCTELTGLTQRDLEDNGIPFRDACNIISKEYSPTHRLWAAWGEYDRKMFSKMCTIFECDFPFSKMYKNISHDFTLLKGGKNHGLSFALKELGMTYEGHLHRAADDAWNTGRVLGEMFKRIRQSSKETS